MSDEVLEQFITETPIRRAAILKCVQSFGASLSPGARVMDAGAGAAPYRDLFRHCEYVTHDWSNSVHHGEPDVVGDLQTGIDLPDGSFDGILCTEVLEHVTDVRRAIAELHRLLVPRGRIAITVPFVMPLHEEPYDYWRPTPYSLTEVLLGVGFVEIDVQPLTGVFGTIAEILSDLGYSIWKQGTPFSMRNRIVAWLARGTAHRFRGLFLRLDTYDARKALPAGWSVTAVKVG